MTVDRNVRFFSFNITAVTVSAAVTMLLLLTTTTTFTVATRTLSEANSLGLGDDDLGVASVVGQKDNLIAENRTLYAAIGEDEEIVHPVALPSGVEPATSASGVDAPRTELRYALEAFGRPFSIRVQPQASFLAADLLIGHTAPNYTWVEPVAPGADRCFYVGRLDEEPSRSQVVLNVCNGLSGHIATQESMYSIRPLTRSSTPVRSSTPTTTTITTLAPHVLQRSRQRSTRSPSCDASDFQVKKSLTPLPKFRQEDDGEAMTGSSIPRARRSISRDLHLEIMVTADSTMKDYYGDGLHDYIFTLMSIVAHIFRDASVGNSITVALVKIAVTEEDEDSKFVSTDASFTLHNFCKWQSRQNYRNDSYYLHYDVAVLLTRVDICRFPNKCDTLGLADLGTVCDELSSCAIVEDNGLSAAFTIVHELGHVLNVPHDDDVRCHNYSGYQKTTRNVMARFLDLNTNPWSWSACSAHFLTEFLGTDSAKCMRDKPGTNRLSWRLSTGDLPGELFEADRQCEMLYGAGTKVCPYMERCSSLWCLMSDNKGCRTHHMPWADGTPCANGHWCYRGRCLPKASTNLKPVDGQWGRWNKFGECSRTCGGGIQRSVRLCNNPPPANGGKYCTGERIRFQSCQIQECPSGSIGFREQQCAEFEVIHFVSLGLPANIRWQPKYSGIRPGSRCKLYCRVTSSSSFHLLRDKVVDGTPCGLDTFDICVNGQCIPAGCDHKLYSKMRLDGCGVCGGSNQTCRRVSGHFNNGNKYGYNHVVSIPAGSVNVDITQHGFGDIKEDDNYLALLSDRNEYILNGEFTVTTSRKVIEYGGTMLEYTGTSVVVERINSSRPLTRDLVVQVLSVGKLHPPDIHYRYNEKVEAPPKPRFVWTLEDDWSECSSMCMGQQTRRAVCVGKVSGHRTSDERCTKTSKPSGLARTCNDHCTLSWAAVNSSECQSSGHCGEGIIERDVVCLLQHINREGVDNGRRVDPENCAHLHDEKPASRVSCYKKCQEATWEYTSWSQCSRTCNGGNQTRKAMCKSSDGRLLSDDHCAMDSLEATMRSCAREDCPVWQVAEWTSCSARCSGKRLRPYWCQVGEHIVSPSLCDIKRMPPSEEPCSEPSCFSWVYGDWSRCSATCGQGVSRRLVHCRTVDGDFVDDEFCEGELKPTKEEPCDSQVPCSSHAQQSVSEVDVATTQKSFSGDHNDNRVNVVGPYFKWKHGPWRECSATCGIGYRTRTVGCVDVLTEVDNESDESCKLFSSEEKPAEVELCKLRPCATWRSGKWSECSKTCGGGTKERVVICENELYTISDQCDPKLRPDAIAPCNEEPCPPHWITGMWTECSTKCGRGTQRRQLECVDDDGVVHSDEDCPASERPEQVQECHLRDCHRPADGDPSAARPTRQYTWRTGPWSSCTVTCGSGRQKRQVICMAHGEEIVFPEKCPLPAPPNIQPCHRAGCPQWVFIDNWSPCSKSCGGGTQWRLAVCYREGHQVDAKMCEAISNTENSDGNGNSRPDMEQRACSLENCLQSARWSKTPWSQCSKNCLQRRRVHCVDKQGDTLNDDACASMVKPKTSRRCRKCRHSGFAWMTGPWSDCTSTCGQGYRTRSISCHRINRLGWVHPEKHDRESDCDAGERPRTLQNCNLGDCNAPFRWMTSPWQPCSSTCGPGIRKRRLYCADTSGQRVAKKSCGSSKKPNRRQKCNLRPCVAVSCQELQVRSRTTRDDYYSLWIRGRSIRIYCADMNTSNPKEYLPVSDDGGRQASGRRRQGHWTDERENFSEVYEKRLTKIDTCPGGGRRLDTCDCLDTGSVSGLTIFYKIRLNVTTLRVTTQDFRFTRQMHGQPIDYGKAGDCYSRIDCPQGRFSIDLTGTGLVVHPSTTWVSRGQYARDRITRSSDGRIITGLCGGYCGECIPDPSRGLLLDVEQPP